MKMINEPLSSDEHLFISISQQVEKYECGNLKDLFINAEVLKRNTEVVLCASLEDALLMKTNGVHNCLAMIGSLDPCHIKALASFRVATVLVALEEKTIVAEISGCLEKINIACKHISLAPGRNLDQELQCYDDSLWKSPRKEHLADLYMSALLINNVHHSIEADEFCKWQYDLETLRGVIDFFILNHAGRQQRPYSWDWDRTLFQFGCWASKHIKTPDNIDFTTLHRYQLYMMSDTKDNHGRLLAESTQCERTKSVTELLGALEAHGIVSLKNPGLKKQFAIH